MLSDNGQTVTSHAKFSFSYQPKDSELTENSVIIRRGDNLWQISKRLWGRGIRYTIIYEANRDHIKDPHWIYPGQIFKVPNKVVQ